MASNGDINPYFANIAAQALLKAGPAYNAHVKNYMSWYFAHLNNPDNLGVSGSIYDYYGDERPKNSYDSSDAYCGTFLSLAREYYRATGDIAFLNANKNKLSLIASCIDATLQPNNLTFAKKNYAIAYLMDNVEVWKGYDDYSALLEAMGETQASGAYAVKASAVRNAIEKLLWVPARSEYLPYYGSTMSWAKFYPDAAANMWPVIFGLPEASSRKNALWTKFKNAQGAKWVSNTADAFPWTRLAIAAIEAGDEASARQFDSNTRAKFFPAKLWPWYIVESAGVIEYTPRLG